MTSPDFAHRPSITKGRWSMLAYLPDRPELRMEYQYRAGSEKAALAIAKFEASYAGRTHVKVRQPNDGRMKGAVVYDGPLDQIETEGRQGWQ